MSEEQFNGLQNLFTAMIMESGCSKGHGVTRYLSTHLGVDTERDTKLSKKLSYLLRHSALKEGIEIKPDGFVSVEQLLKKKLSGYNLDDIKRIVDNDIKQRFALTEKNGILEIKANQGHTIKTISQLSLRLIENPDFNIIHGTYLEHWPKIKSKGLSRMQRNHIHFAKGLNFLCGLRASAQIYIFINFQKTNEANLIFHESDNGVILCSGNEHGILETKYFLKVTKRNGEILWPET